VGANGKSKLQDFVNLIFGDYQTIGGISYIVSKRIEPSKPQPDLIACKNRRIVWYNEPEHVSPLNSSIVKEITGGDKMTCRDLYARNETFVFHAYPILCCNEFPTFSDRTVGMLRRILYVPFDVQFVKDPDSDNPVERQMDPTISQAFERWKNVFASYLVNEHYKVIMAKEDYLEIPQKILGRTNDFKQETDYIQDFIDDCIVLTNNKEDVLSFRQSPHVQSVWPAFVIWYKSNYPNDRQPPNQMSVRPLLEKKFKKPVWKIQVPKQPNKIKGWSGMILNQ